MISHADRFRTKPSKKILFAYNFTVFLFTHSMIFSNKINTLRRDVINSGVFGVKYSNITLSSIDRYSVFPFLAIDKCLMKSQS